AELRAVNPRPASMPKTARSATTATTQGSRPVPGLRGVATRPPAGPTGDPQCWQNLDPGVSSPPQAAQRPAARPAPQLEQKRPDAGEPHEGHVVGVGRVIRGTYIARSPLQLRLRTAPPANC